MGYCFLSIGLGVLRGRRSVGLTGEHPTPCPKPHLCADGSGRKQAKAGMKEMGSHRFCSLSARNEVRADSHSSW